MTTRLALTVEGPWRYTHPRFRAAMLRRIVPDAILVECCSPLLLQHRYGRAMGRDRLVSNIDARALLLRGCFAGFGFHRGRLHLQVRDLDLMICGMDDVLAAWLRPTPECGEHYLRALRAFFVNGDRETALAELESATATCPDQRLAEAIFHAVLTGDRGAFERRMAPERAVVRASQSDLGLLARFYGLVWHDEMEMLRLLSFDAPDEDSAPVDAAETWLLALGDERRAQELLEGSEGSCRRPDGWRRLAHSWIQLFARKDRARRCLLRSEWGTYPLDCNFGLGPGGRIRRFAGFAFFNIPESWVSLFGDACRARRLLTTQSRKATGAPGLLFVAAAWKHLFDDDRRALRALQRACRSAKDGAQRAAVQSFGFSLLGRATSMSDWRAQRRLAGTPFELAQVAADLWRRGEPAASRELLLRAETRAGSPDDWLELAERWSELHGDAVASRRCLLRCRVRPKRAQWDSALLRLASAWMSCCGDQRRACRALRRLEKAVANSPNAHHWASMARYWQTLGRSAADARRCLRMFARRLPRRPSSVLGGWQCLAVCWKNVHQDPRIAADCLKRAEKAADECDDWIFIADLWRQLFDRRRDANRCLRRAERSNATPLELANAWLRHGGAEATRRFLLRAERDRTDPRWLSEVAAVWRITVGDLESSRRCFDAANAAAVDSRDLLMIAFYWEWFGDPKAAEQCLTRAEALAHTTSEWCSISEDWKRLLGLRGRAKICLRKAEELAKGPDDWRSVAWQWRAVLGDRASARRCARMARNAGAVVAG